MKRVKLIGILCLIIATLFTGCGNTQLLKNETNDSNFENEVVESEDDNNEGES